MDVDGPCSDITLNMRDMRSKFGFITLYEIARISRQKENTAVCYIICASEKAFGD
jgi:hypothetical protein